MAGARRSGLGLHHGGATPADEPGRTPRGSHRGPLGLEMHGSQPPVDWVARVQESTWSQTKGEPLPAPPPPPSTPSARAPKEVKEGWVEVEVVDEAGNPVVGQPYKLKLPDGRVMEGKLGSNGVISVHAIDPGSCTLSFPELDGRAWSLG